MLHEFTQSVEDTARAVVNEIHTALPGEILSFDQEKCEAKVRPIGKYLTSDEQELDYPILTEVPVLFPFCKESDMGMFFPVKKGDNCLILVSEVELDEWRSGAETECPLRFDLTSAVAIPGLLKQGSPMLDKALEREAVVIGTPGWEIIADKEKIQISVGDTELTVSESGIAARGDLIVTGNISCTGSFPCAK